MLCNFFLVDDRLGGFLDGKRDLCQAYTTGRVEGGGVEGGGWRGGGGAVHGQWWEWEIKSL